MNSADAIILWTPDREPFLSNPLRGQIVVTTIPPGPEYKNLTHSVGACDLGWKDKTDSERFAKIRRLVEQIVNDDNVPMDRVRTAFAVVEGLVI